MNVSERFLKYVSFETTSNENSSTVPSSDCQKLLGKYLADELKELGLTDAHMDDLGYVYGWIPASKGCENCDTIGLIAHMDTCPDVSGKDVKPQIIKYTGGDIGAPVHSPLPLPRQGRSPEPPALRNPVPLPIPPAPSFRPGSAGAESPWIPPEYPHSGSCGQWPLRWEA